ncbi:hypothetical protein AB0H83_37615 [Dactylosporangium sp. NPDC050688]|uniref:hypothetical protein n=1 Tax=Dactylosporangium sp. NPDC050688 TaxID=3157217 RepID=UPI0033EF7602
MLRPGELEGLWQIRDTATAQRAAIIRDMVRWTVWLTRAGLATLLLASLLLTPRAEAQAAHLQLGHPAVHSTTAGHDHHGAAGEHSHEHHHTVLHTAGVLAQPHQPKLIADASTFTVPSVAVAGPAPRTVPDRDTGQPQQSHLQVWRI